MANESTLAERLDFNLIVVEVCSQPRMSVRI
jgi:hypothetical protein